MRGMETKVRGSNNKDLPTLKLYLKSSFNGGP